MDSTPLGASIPRTDAVERVTGRTVYTADYRPKERLHGVLVESGVPSGRVTRVHDEAARAAPGVRLVLTQTNMPRLNPLPSTGPGGMDESRQPLQDDRIVHHGQHLGLVVADTLERAQYAASLLRFDVEPAPFDVEFSLDDARAVLPPGQAGAEGDRKNPVRRGDAAAAFAAVERKHDAIYTTPTEHHNPMETIATTAEWRGDSLHLYETSRQIKNMQGAVAKSFGLPEEKVRIEAERVGGAFGSKGFLYGHMLLTATAARMLGRPVSTVTTRRQMFGSVGHRPRTVQRVALGASADGRLKATRHLTVSDTSTVSGYLEPCALTTRKLYATDTLETVQWYVPLELPSSCPMRAPGEAPGPFALESAMDELAQALGIDPVELRLRNDSPVDLDSGKPWSIRHLRECFERASARFGWAERDPKPRSMRDGHELIGWGCAGVAYRAGMSKATVAASLGRDGVAEFRASGSDVGQGALTAMSQVAADATGLPLSRVRVLLGDSAFPPAPGAGGSVSAASVGNGIVAAAAALKRAAGTDDLTRARGPLKAEGTQDFKPDDRPFAFHSWGAVFAEVAVDEALGMVRCRRIVGVYDVGRVLNERLVRSQLTGGIVWAIGMALQEHTAIDPKLGIYANRDLAEYHVPVNLDVPEIDVSWLGIPDPHFGPLGAHGVGEVGIAGTPAAIANAVHHATGVRVRDLPITLDKLL